MDEWILTRLEEINKKFTLKRIIENLSDFNNGS